MEQNGTERNGGSEKDNIYKKDKFSFFGLFVGLLVCCLVSQKDSAHLHHQEEEE